VAGPGRLRSENLTLAPTGARERSTVVVDGDAVRLWTPRTGVIAWDGDPCRRIALGWESLIRAPGPLVAGAGADAEVLGESTVAGRPALRVRLPGGRELALDRARGILLADVTWQDGRPVRGAVFTEIRLDVAIEPAAY
jgi:hypothetical protein